MIINPNTSLAKNALNFGALTGVVLSVLNLLFLFTGLADSLSWIIYLVLILGIFWGSRQYRFEVGNGYISYGQAFTFGFLTALGASLIFVFVFYLYMKYMDTTYLGQILDQMEISLYEGKMPQDEIDTFMTFYRKMLTPGMLAAGLLFSYVLMGTIISLITSIFIKNPKSPFED